MAKAKNLAGIKFGRLTAMEQVGTKDKNRRMLWICMCECGTQKEVNSRSLISGNTKSCGGCRSQEYLGKDLVGQKFGKLQVVEFFDRDRHMKPHWLCKCDCGKDAVVGGDNLKKGIAKSCGCIRSQMMSTKNKTHGLHKTKTYQNWLSMRWRLKNSVHYIKRGIKSCSGYNDFTVFKQDLGDMVGDRNTVDRIDPNGHYSCGKCEECIQNGWPMNIRWANMKEQANNRTNTIRIKHDGKNLTLAEWSEEVNIGSDTLRNRLYRGWPIETVLSQTARALLPYKYNGEAKSLKAWAETYQINYLTLKKRIYGLGWSLEMAITEPVYQRIGK